MAPGREGNDPNMMKASRPVGIVGYGSYVPRYRLPAQEVSQLWTDGNSPVPVREKSVNGIDEDVAAWDAAASKIERWRDLSQADFEKKLSPFLARRGFGYDTIRRTVRRAWNELHQE